MSIDRYYTETVLWRKDPETVERLIRRALQVPGTLPEPVRTNLEISLAYVFLYARRLNEAGELIASVLDRHPTDAQARWCHAQLAFFLDAPDAWELLEARWAVGYTTRPIPAPLLWDGSPLRARSLLFAGEGGLGDQIQFIRFASALKNAGAGRVLVSMSAPLIPLVKAMPEVDAMIPLAAGSGLAGIDYDVGLPMLSAPRFFSAAASDRVAEPYLEVPGDRVVAVQRRIQKSGASVNVGLCWTSKYQSRSLPLAMFRELAEIGGVQLYALGERQVLQPEIAGFPIIDFGSDAADLLTTAGAVAALDVIVSVDTMMAHLAGGLGRPVWTLLHQVPDWRWSLNGTSTRWYPTMRLFRQETREWEPVIQRVAAELRARVDLNPRR